MKNQELLSDGKRGMKKPLPFSWVIIAILLYLLLQVSYIALKPTPHTIGMSYRYDRSRINPQAEPPPPAAPPRPGSQSHSPSTPLR